MARIDLDLHTHLGFGSVCCGVDVDELADVRCWRRRVGIEVGATNLRRMPIFYVPFPEETTWLPFQDSKRRTGCSGCYCQKPEDLVKTINLIYGLFDIPHQQPLFRPQAVPVGLSTDFPSGWLIKILPQAE